MELFFVHSDFFLILHLTEKMEKNKTNLMMLVESMAPLRLTKWLEIFTLQLASKHSFNYPLISIAFTSLC